MKNLERFIELCLQEWPKAIFEFIVLSGPRGQRLYIKTEGLTHPICFDNDNGSFGEPDEMIRAVKDAMESFLHLEQSRDTL